jgi:hypothetical protein
MKREEINREKLTKKKYGRNNEVKSITIKVKEERLLKNE